MSSPPGNAFQVEVRSEFCSTARRIGELGATDDLSSCHAEALLWAKGQVLHAAAVELARYLQSVNSARSKFVRMVPDLLGEIFGYLSIMDRFSATEVCHNWRAVALALPHVWADLTQFGFVSPRLTVALTRARGHPVRLGFSLRSIAVNYAPSYGPRRDHRDQHSVDTILFLDCMAARLQQVVSLDIKVYGAGHSLSPLHDALARPAPLLQSFRFQVLSSGSEVRNDIFAGTAPQLRELELSHILPPSQATSCFHAVRRLLLTVGPLQEFGFSTIFMNLPHLVEFEVDAPSTVPFTYDQTQNLAHSLAVLVPKLRILRLLGDSRWTLMLPFHKCTHISVLAPEPPISEALWDRCSPPARLAVLSDSNRAVFLGGANDDGSVRMVSNAFARDDARRLFEVSITTYLRAFVTDTRTWIDNVHPATVELPQLKYLHVIAYVQEGRYALCQRLPEWLRVPKLHVLRVSAVAIPEALPHCSHDVATAVDRFVATVAPAKLSFIELDNIAVQNIPGDCVRRKISTPLAHFLPMYTDRFARWDDWLENALHKIPDA
ncbi:hypothetical protein AURDEDRAFT_187942 [Auricularia subglabra TFB-10046 SS5]|nr:hypothetical protein AURDEDRAFT_187942 [Auricularia subglabra TFB-10046 SS5]